MEEEEYNAFIASKIAGVDEMDAMQYAMEIGFGIVPNERKIQRLTLSSKGIFYASTETELLTISKDSED